MSTLRRPIVPALLALAIVPAASRLAAQDPVVQPLPDGMKTYTEDLAGSDLEFDMVAIPGGTYTMGSPASEPGRDDAEGPQRRVRVDPFWMSKTEITWDLYEAWAFNLEKMRRPDGYEPGDNDATADGVTRPTPPYTDMTFGMGRDGYPAICMTQKAAATFCEWLSAKTGHRYRLPTEAEWEWACRAGTTTPWSFGDDPEKAPEYAVTAETSDGKYGKVGQRKPNPWGLHDMHGNVAEWCQDQFAPYEASESVLVRPVVKPTEYYPRVVRGGSWDHPVEASRSAARMASDLTWKMQDPQLPQSVWYHTDAQFVGFRVVREPVPDTMPDTTPDKEAQAKTGRSGGTPQ